MSVLSVPAADGGSIGAFQPAPDSVTGSPFTVTSGAAVPTPTLSGLLMVFSSELIHVRFTKTGEAATTDDMPVQPDQLAFFPMDSHVMSMIAASTTATVWANMATNVGA